MLGRGVAAANPGPDAVAPLRPLRRHLAGADLTVGNLESTLSDDGRPQQGGDSFAAPQDVAAGLAELGLDAVSLANNHSGDYGEAALLDTLRTLRRSRLAAFGAGADLAEASRAVVLDHAGLKFGFLGFNAIGETPRATGDTPGALSIRMPPRTGPLNESDLAHVERLVQRLDDRVDVVVVLPHWGAQYTHTPEPSQLLVARRLVAAGADLVAGGHPHWVQGLDRVGDAVVAHSLGNLVFDMDFAEQAMEGITLTATFWGARLGGVELTPYRMDERFSPRLIDGAASHEILNDVWAASTGPFSRP
jgi:poly-gamma-glutamate synthesis protein (capsule biosynthesis protein)